MAPYLNLLAILEQKISHVVEGLSKGSARVDIAVSGLVGFLTGISYWLISKA